MRKPKRNSPTKEATASQLARPNWSLRPALRKRAGRRKIDPNPGRNSKKDNKTSNTRGSFSWSPTRKDACASMMTGRHRAEERIEPARVSSTIWIKSLDLFERSEEHTSELQSRGHL